MFSFVILRCLIFGTDGLWNVISANSSVEIVRYAEQMNERNNHAGEDRDWTNPSKCLVDKALEQWSTTRMRADNTSVVIVIIDPPGPPKRDALRATPQQFIVENSQCEDNGEEGVMQLPLVITNPDLSNYSLFDHSTNELTELDKIANLQNQSIDRVNHLEDPSMAFDEETVGLNSAMTFENAYAAAYNPMIHPIADDPIAQVSYAEQSVQTEASPKEEPYSLICLETGQTTTTGYYSPYQSTSSSVTEIYEPTPHPLQHQSEFSHNYYPDQYQFDSISSSFLSQSCGIIQNNPSDSVHTDLTNSMLLPASPKVVDNPLAHHQTLHDPEEHLEDSTNDYLEHYYGTCPNAKSLDETITTIDRSGAAASNPDVSIQIDEISSSSKENEANPSVQYHIPLLRSSKKSLMRMTRSAKLQRTPSFDSRTKKPKTIAKKVVATKSASKCSSTTIPSRVSVGRSSPISTPVTTRPNLRGTLLTTVVSVKRHSLRSNLELCKQTLRSKNTIGFKTKASAPVKAKVPKTMLAPKPVAKASSTAAAASSTRSSKLREKVRSSCKLMQTRPKSIVSSLTAGARKLVTIATTDRPIAKSCTIATSTPKTPHSRFRKRLSR